MPPETRLIGRAGSAGRARGAGVLGRLECVHHPGLLRLGLPGLFGLQGTHGRRAASDFGTAPAERQDGASDGQPVNGTQEERVGDGQGLRQEPRRNSPW